MTHIILAVAGGDRRAHAATYPSPMSAAPTETPESADTLSIEQLASRVGMSVRTVRFYAGRGLIPPPRREGRNGYYGPDHLVRLELVRELQAHGFTLAAIEGYLENLPGDASPERVALQRTLLAPWTPTKPETIPRAELEQRAGRALSDDDLELLVALGVVDPTPTEDVFEVAPAHLGLGVSLIDIGLPIEAADAARRVFAEHGRAMAHEIDEVFRVHVWPHLKESHESPAQIRAIVERFKPLTIQALVNSYAQAIDETKRASVHRRT